MEKWNGGMMGGPNNRRGSPYEVKHVRLDGYTAACAFINWTH